MRAKLYACPNCFKVVGLTEEGFVVRHQLDNKTRDLCLGSGWAPVDLGPPEPNREK